MKKYTMPFLVTFTLLASSVSVCASASTSGLKVAVVENAVGSKELVSGAVKKGLTKLETTSETAFEFENNMGLCAAYIKDSDVSKAETTCTAAIETVDAIEASNAKVAYLKSLSYSNRAIARYVANDVTGAMTDLVEAILIDDNAITRGNLASIRDMEKQRESSTAFVTAE